MSISKHIYTHVGAYFYEERCAGGGRSMGEGKGGARV